MLKTFHPLEFSSLTFKRSETKAKKFQQFCIFDLQQLLWQNSSRSALVQPDTSLPSSAVSVSALSLRCKVGQVCEEVMRVPLVNMAWEQALATWGQYGMSADEHRRRKLTRTFHSSSVRADTAAEKFLAAQVINQRKRVFKDRCSFIPFIP